MKKIFFLLMLSFLLSCANQADNSAEDDRITDLRTKTVKLGCFISVQEAANVWSYTVDCNGVEGTCVGTAAALKVLNEYRAALFGSVNHNTLTGRDKALNDGIGEALAKVSTVRNAISPTCAK